MRKMIIHFGPDSEGGGTLRHEIRDTDPARKRHTEHTEPMEETKSWREWLPKEIAHRVSRFERILDAVEASDVGRTIARKVKDMPRNRKIAAGVILAAGIAGAAYLATRKDRK